MEIWNDLKTRYFEGDLSRIFDLQIEVFPLNQGDLSITIILQNLGLFRMS